MWRLPGLEMGPGPDVVGDGGQQLRVSQQRGPRILDFSSSGLLATGCRLSVGRGLPAEPPGPGLTCWGFGAQCWRLAPQGPASS